MTGNENLEEICLETKIVKIKIVNLFSGGFLPFGLTVWRRHGGDGGNIRLSGKPSWLGGLIG